MKGLHSSMTTYCCLEGVSVIRWMMEVSTASCTCLLAEYATCSSVRMSHLALMESAYSVELKGP